MFFDPAVDPIVTNKTPPPGKDILTASANNLYSGVSLADLKGFTEKYGLNSRLVKQPNGKLVEEVYRVGGRYSKEITAIVGHLEAAIPYASEPMANALRALIQFYRTGEKADREKYDIAWVNDKASPVDTINGFIEVYLDARGVKGGWEGLVFYVNQEKTERIRKFADNAQWFEDRMPYDASVPQADGQGHRRQRHRRRGRDRRLGPGDADRHQPAQRSGDPRAARQQVGVAEQRRRGQRQGHPGHDAQRVLVDARGGRAQPASTARSRASSSPTCTR